MPSPSTNVISLKMYLRLTTMRLLWRRILYNITYCSRRASRMSTMLPPPLDFLWKRPSLIIVTYRHATRLLEEWRARSFVAAKVSSLSAATWATSLPVGARQALKRLPGIIKAAFSRKGWGGTTSPIVASSESLYRAPETYEVLNLLPLLHISTLQ